MSAVEQVAARVLAVYGGWNRDTPVKQMREDWDGLFPAPTAPTRADVLDGIPVQWVGECRSDDARLFIYLHGGGFQIGSFRSHGDLIERIAKASNATALVIDYPLAPEHRYPAQIEAILAVCTALEARGVDLHTTCLVGDSAGGNLVLAVTQALRDRGSLLPAALVLLSPWLDLTMSGASYETRKTADPIHRRKMLVNLAQGYVGEVDAAGPLTSPINADLHGFPPMLIQVGDNEILLSDADTLAASAAKAGVEAALTVWPGMIHVFQQFAQELPQARDAIAAIGAFLSSAFERSGSLR